MGTLDDTLSDLSETVYRLRDILSSKSIRLPVAAVEDLQASLQKIQDELTGYFIQLEQRHLDDYNYPTVASTAVEPYLAHALVPLKGGGLLVVAELPPWADLPKTELDESSQHVDVVTYLDTNDEKTINQVLARINDLVETLGYKQRDDADVERGSIFSRGSAGSQQAVNELKSALAKAERALELAQLELRQAEVDSKEAQAVNALIASLDEVPRACIRVGSVLLIKYPLGTEPLIIVRNLTQLELHALGRFPEIQKNPERVLETLGMALAKIPENPGEVTGGEQRLRTARLRRPGSEVPAHSVLAACQNGMETGDIDGHQDDNETGPDQHRSSLVSTRNRHGKETVSGLGSAVPAVCPN
jgi:hypothetical protein